MYYQVASDSVNFTHNVNWSVLVFLGNFCFNLEKMIKQHLHIFNIANLSLDKT